MAKSELFVLVLQLLEDIPDLDPQDQVVPQSQGHSSQAQGLPANRAGKGRKAMPSASQAEARPEVRVTHHEIPRQQQNQGPQGHPGLLSQLLQEGQVTSTDENRPWVAGGVRISFDTCFCCP